MLTSGSVPSPLSGGRGAGALGSPLVVGQRRSDASGQPAAEVVSVVKRSSPSRRQIRGASGRGVMMGALRPESG